MGDHERQEAGREGNGAPPRRGVAPSVIDSASASYSEGKERAAAETEGRKPEIEITPEMIQAAAERLREYVIDEDLVQDWMPDVLSAALEVAPQSRQ